MPPLVTVALGTLLIAFTLQQCFQDLFHPSESGALSDFLGRTVFSLFRIWPRILPMAGPLCLILVIGSWTLLLALGFALFYYAAHLPPDPPRFLSSLNLSLAVMITMGSELPAQPLGLRLLMTVQGILGFGLLTASVSWIVLLYPALSRVRLLARGVSVLVEAERITGLPLAAVDSDLFLANLARDAVRTRIDLVHFPIIYYFASHTRRASLPPSLTHLVRFAAQGLEPGRPPRVRLAAASLQAALDDLAAILAEKFVRADPRDPAAVFRAYQNHHS